MTAFEIALTVIFSFLAFFVSMFCFQASFLIDKVMNRRDNEKKPASENEADENK